MSLTPEQLGQILDEKLLPIYDKLSEVTSKLEVISKDLGEIRRDLGYDNLRVIKTSNREQM